MEYGVSGLGDTSKLSDEQLLSKLTIYKDLVNNMLAHLERHFPLPLIKDIVESLIESAEDESNPQVMIDRHIVGMTIILGTYYATERSYLALFQEAKARKIDGYHTKKEQ
jgi:hypothetical protein